MEPDSQDSQQGDQERKRVVRFSAGEDILALIEVLADNPYEMSSRWKDIALRLQTKSPKAFTARNVRERVEHILKLFIKGEREILKKSGTEEEYTDREHLLEQVKSLKETSSVIPKGKRAKTEAQREEGKQLRLAAAAALSTQYEESVEDVEDSQLHFETVYAAQSEECSFGFPEFQSTSSPSASPTVIQQYATSKESTAASVREEITSSNVTTTSTIKVTGMTPPTTSFTPSLTAMKPPTTLAPVVPTTPSNTLVINSSTPKSVGTKRKAAFNKAVIDHMHQKKESEFNIQLRNIHLETIKAENEKKRLELEETKQKMLMENQNKIFEASRDNEKKTRELEKKLDIITDNQKTILALLLQLSNKPLRDFD